MAARWETVIGSGVKAWAPHRCEDYVIIDALLRVRDQEAYDRDMTLLFNRYLGQGEALSDADLELLNERLADAGLDPVELIETRPDSYAQQKGYGKANVRNAIMRTIAGMTVSKRTETIMQYRQEALSGPKPMYNGNGVVAPAAAMASATPPASSEPPIAAPRAADGGVVRGLDLIAVVALAQVLHRRHQAVELLQVDDDGVDHRHQLAALFLHVALEQRLRGEQFVQQAADGVDV